MKKALFAIVVIAGLAVASAIDICVLVGLLPITAAACVSLTMVIIFIATNPRTPSCRGFACIRVAHEWRAAKKGEDYVITGKSIHHNPGKFE